MTVGAPLKGRALIIDDVITAGTAIRECMEIIDNAGAELAGVVIALDRQERGQGELSAIQEIEQKYNVPVINIIQLDDLKIFLIERGDSAELITKIEAYQQEYGLKR